MHVQEGRETQINSVGLSMPKGFLVYMPPESFLPAGSLVKYLAKYYSYILCNACLIVPCRSAVVQSRAEQPVRRCTQR